MPNGKIHIDGVELEVQPTPKRYRKERIRVGAIYQRSLSGKLITRFRALKWRWELSGWLLSDLDRIKNLFAAPQPVPFVDIDGAAYLVGIVSDLPLDMYTEYTLVLEEV